MNRVIRVYDSLANNAWSNDIWDILSESEIVSKSVKYQCKLNLIGQDEN